MIEDYNNESSTNNVTMINKYYKTVTNATTIIDFLISRHL